MRLNIIGGFALLLLPVIAFAQAVPRPGEFYFDEDPRTASPIIVAEGDDEATQQRLLRMVERNHRNASAALAQLAHIAMASGRADVGRALYAQLLEGGGGGGLRSSVHWNYGWDLYRAGDPEAALVQWLAAFNNRPQNPEWAPPTLALALWRLERPDEAKSWYAAAVRTWPDRWLNPGDLSAVLPDWREDERAVLRQVHAAWIEDPPSWP